MSRTKRGQKPPGFEYWTTRPGNKTGGHYSARGDNWQKRQTHKAERQQGKREGETE